MEISTPALAVFIAVLSLALSLHTSIATRRANQLQRLASIRTKLSNLIWKIQFDLYQYERYARKFDQFLNDEDDEAITFMEYLEYIRSDQATIAELKSPLDSMSSKLSRYPFFFRVGGLDEVEHLLDSIRARVDIASENLLPIMQKLVERIDEASRA
ncbi:MAG: hypothetical protein Q7T94_05160 [Rugosibacter sp.]|nr:hypothetical protein [Rugosibacter sp.]